MTAKELETEIKNGKFDEKKTKKMELVLNATKALTSSIRSTLVDKQILRESTEQFLKHKKFRDALLEIIFNILEHKEDAHHLRRSELDLLMDEDASILEYKDVLNKTIDVKGIVTAYEGQVQIHVYTLNELIIA